MMHIIIQLETPGIQALEMEGDEVAIIRGSRQRGLKQTFEGAAPLTAYNGIPQRALAMIIEGRTLAYALEDMCICCHSSPKRKVLVIRLVKSGPGKTTVGIGNGVNDVGILPKTDIGVGINAVKRVQAAMFRDLENYLLHISEY